jgi:hypothetical protein
LTHICLLSAAFPGHSSLLPQTLHFLFHLP